MKASREKYSKKFIVCFYITGYMPPTDVQYRKYRYIFSLLQ